MSAKNESTLILSLETAMRAGSVSVSRGQSILCSRAGNPEVSHSSDLLRLIRTVLEEAGVTLRDMEVFAASAGPGSFTGLRIGLATVKSFAATLSRPCVGVPTLEAIAAQAGPSSRTLAVLPAGRGELFAQLFRVDRRGSVEEVEGTATHLSPGKLLDQASSFKGRLVWTGEGAEIHRSMLRERALAEGIRYIEGLTDESGADAEDERLWVLARPQGILAESIAARALKRYDAGQACSAESLRAIYVRASDAELKES